MKLSAKKRHARGVSLVEVLVVAVGCTVLMALLVAAIDSARKDSRRVRLKQMGIVEENREPRWDGDSPVVEKDASGGQVYYLVLTNDLKEYPRSGDFHGVSSNRVTVEMLCKALRHEEPRPRVYRVLPEDISSEF